MQQVWEKIKSWPFIFDGFVAFQANKRIAGRTPRFAIIGIVLFFTLFIGSAWIYGYFNPKPQVRVTKEIVKPTVEAQPTTANQNIPTVNQVNPSPVPSLTPTLILTLTPIPPSGIEEEQVVKVVDGDTIQVSSGKVIRIIGIDTPETVDPRKTVQCFGIEASNKAKEILLNKTVQLESDATQGNKDKYNRYLRYVWMDNKTTDYGASMIQNGYAFEYTYYLPYKYQEKYKALQKEAEQNKKGLWADGACSTKSTTQDISNPTVQNSPPAQKISEDFTCVGKTKCAEMVSCAEAMFYLNNCGVSGLDGDKDGVPCETLCR